MNKILLVDDDRELTSLLKELLDMEGFNVLVAHDGEQALSLLDDSIDLLLLDVMMPKKNGIDTLKALRQTHQTPVIMLTARGSELDRVLGLELGADDYLPKPFNDRELVARIRAILRRSHWSEQQQTTEVGSPTLEVDALSLNPGRQEANFDGQTLELTGTEFTLLYLLAQHLGQVVSREHLSQEVLGKRLTPFDRAIDVQVSRLRKLIEIVEIGKQLLITRGALTTFSIANDVAKYFAIIPALFSPIYPGLGALNILGLTNPLTAVLSAIIYNALVIVALIPAALKGVKYREATSQSLLKRNLAVYGLGGIVAPFIGIRPPPVK